MSTYIQSVSAKSKFTSAREGIQARKVSMQDRSAGIDIQGGPEDAGVGLDVFQAPCTIEKLVSYASPAVHNPPGSSGDAISINQEGQINDSSCARGRVGQDLRRFRPA